MKKEKEKEIRIFDYLNQIFYKRKKLEYDKKISNAYMLSQWLSHDNELIEIVNDINKIQFSLSDEMIYWYYWYKVPKKRRFIKWVKKTKTKDQKKKIEKLKNNYPNLSSRELKMLLKHVEDCNL
jgi:hypothetical protein